MKFTHITLACAVALSGTLAGAQTTGKLKVGLMLPATGAFASLGTAQMLSVGLAAVKGDIYRM